MRHFPCAICVAIGFGLPASGLAGQPIDFENQVAAFKVVHESGPDGGLFGRELVPGADGKLHGTSEYGGAFDKGTVFRMTPGGHVTVLHSFGGDGTAPAPKGLTLGSDGHYYGVTAFGGANGVGTVYRMSPHGGLSVLHDFVENASDCAVPAAVLVEGSDGNFYGTAEFGGAFGHGCVFKIAPHGRFKVLHSFTGGDGSTPGDRLVESGDGYFYGTTTYGGQYGAGTVFRIAPGGALDVLHSFDLGGPDGGFPRSGLTEAQDGQFYGVNAEGGRKGGGTLYRMSRDGALVSLHSFGGADGSHPYGDLLLGSDGSLYGVTYMGGRQDVGVAYRVTMQGVFTRLHSFDSASDGGNALGGMVELADGEFYGTTSAGGTGGNGAVYRIRLKQP